jgi:Cu-processing system ATP-binding protein
MDNYRTEEREAMTQKPDGIDAAIEIQGLGKRYGTHHVLSNVSVAFRVGEVIALMGPNGSGKSTLIKSIVGLVHPDKGSIRIMGHELLDGITYRRSIGYMPQIAQYPETLAVGELFSMFARLRDDCSHFDYELYDELGIRELETKQLRVLSGGQRQRVSAAFAWFFSPTILLLDEPTAGLDPISTEKIKAKIVRERMQGKCIVMTTHSPQDALELADRIVYLYEGNLRIDMPLAQLLEIAPASSLMGTIAWYLQRDRNQ